MSRVPEEAACAAVLPPSVAPPVVAYLTECEHDGSGFMPSTLAHTPFMCEARRHMLGFSSATGAGRAMEVVYSIYTGSAGCCFVCFLVFLAFILSAFDPTT